MKQAIKFALVAAAMTAVLAGCSKTEDATLLPPKVDAPAGQGAGDSGSTSNADLKRIRELAEKEDADRAAQQKKAGDLNKQITEGLREPAKVRTY